MKFMVGDEVVSTRVPDTFVVEIKVMHGDADGYNTFEVGPFLAGVENLALTSLVETLDRMSVAFPNGRGASDSYNSVEGFDTWFGWEETDNSIVDSMLLPYVGGWPHDVTYEECEASLDDFQVVYYDNTLVKWTTYRLFTTTTL